MFTTTSKKCFVGYTATVFLIHGKGQTKVFSKQIECGVSHTRGNHCLPSLICAIVGSPKHFPPNLIKSLKSLYNFYDSSK